MRVSGPPSLTGRMLRAAGGVRAAAVLLAFLALATLQLASTPARAESLCSAVAAPFIVSAVATDDGGDVGWGSSDRLTVTFSEPTDRAGRASTLLLSADVYTLLSFSTSLSGSQLFGRWENNSTELVVTAPSALGTGPRLGLTTVSVNEAAGLRVAGGQSLASGSRSPPAEGSWGGALQLVDSDDGSVLQEVTDFGLVAVDDPDTRTDLVIRAQVPAGFTGTAVLLYDGEPAGNHTGGGTYDLEVSLGAPGPHYLEVGPAPGATGWNGRQYVLNVTVVDGAPPTDSALGELSTSEGGAVPGFASGDAGGQVYAVAAAGSSTEIVVTAAPRSDTATVAVNGRRVTSGAAADPVLLPPGVTDIPVVCTAADGVTNSSYVVRVTRQGSDDASLASVAVTMPGAEVTPEPGPGVTAFFATLGRSIDSEATLTVAAAGSLSTVRTSGGAAGCAGTSEVVALAYGDNVVAVNVTSENGTLGEYTVTLSRPNATTALADATSTGGGVVTPALAEETTAYEVTVLFAVTELTLTVTTVDELSTVVPASRSRTTATPLVVGSSNAALTFAVTATDLVERTYSFTPVRLPASTNAQLSDISPAAGTLAPAFDAGDFAYTLTVPNAVTSVTLTATLDDATATVAGAGLERVLGPLAVGNETTVFEVTAEDGATRLNYTVVVVREPSSNAALSSISTSAGTLSPVFDAGEFAYTLTVPNAVTSVTLTATLDDATATVAGAGLERVLSGLEVGVDVDVVFEVTAEDGATRLNYTVVVSRLPSSNAALSSISATAGTLSPGFDAGEFAYTLTLPAAVEDVTLTAALADSTATVAGAGLVRSLTGVAEGATVDAVFEVTAEDGATRLNYTVSVFRPSADAALSLLAPSVGSLSPAFSAATREYALVLENSVTAASVTATLRDGDASVAPDATQAASDLPVGNTTLVFVVTAEDGIAVREYSVVLVRLPSSNARLDNVTASAGALVPAFDADVLLYTVSFGNEITSVDLVATVEDDTATVAAPGATRTVSNLLSGNTDVVFVVTAQDGVTVRNYTVTLDRDESSNAALSDISPAAGTLAPAFDAGDFAYTLTVPNAVTSVTLTATLDDVTATVAGAGLERVLGPLAVGNETTVFEVTAEDGATRLNYTVVVVREPSSNAALSDISPAAGTLAPAFDAGDFAYTLTVPNAVTSVTLTATLDDATATVAGAGLERVLSGLEVGVDVDVVFEVTAEDGATRLNYTVVVSRLPSSNAALSSISATAGTLSPGFDAGELAYTLTLQNAVTAVTLTAALVDSTATVAGAGLVRALAGLSVGSVDAVFEVTAEDGATRLNYTVTVVRLPSSNARLSALAIGGPAALSPAFSAATREYAATVANHITELWLNATLEDDTATFDGGSADATRLLPLPVVGENELSVRVTAEDGVTVLVYTVTVTREASFNAFLASLNVSAGDGGLSPAFSPNTTEYGAAAGALENREDTVEVVAAAEDDGVAAVLVYGEGAGGLAPPATVYVPVGTSAVVVAVTAGDGTTRRNYTVALERNSSSDATLAGLSPPAGLALEPPFSAATRDYTLSVPNSVERVELRVLPADTGSLVLATDVTPADGGGGLAARVVAFSDLPVGSSELAFTVRASDGATELSYAVTVVRAPSSDARLASVSVEGVELQDEVAPPFAPDTLSYAASAAHAVTSARVRVLAVDDGATFEVRVNGGEPLPLSPLAAKRRARALDADPVALEAVVPLEVGANAVGVAVTAQDGVTNAAYEVVLRRWHAPCALVASCNGNGQCSGVPPEDRCGCGSGYGGDACDEVEAEALGQGAQASVLAVSAAALLLSLLAAASGGLAATFGFTPLFSYLQQFALPLTLNDEMRELLDPFRLLNLVLVNPPSSDAQSTDEGGGALYAHGFAYKVALLTVAAALAVLVPGRYLVSCVWRGTLRRHHVTWASLLLFLPTLASALELARLSGTEPAYVAGGAAALLWVAAAATLRPGLREPDGVRTFVPHGQGWSGFAPGQRWRDGSPCEGARRMLRAVARSCSRCRPRCWVYRDETALRNKETGDEDEEDAGTLQTSSSAVALELVEQQQVEEEAAGGEGAAGRDRAGTYDADAAADSGRGRAGSEAVRLQLHSYYQRKTHALDTAAAAAEPGADGASDVGSADDRLDGVGAPVAQGDLWTPFGHRRMLERVVRFQPGLSGEDVPRCGAAPARALRWVRAHCTMYHEFVEMTGVAASAYVSVVLDGTDQMLAVAGVHLLLWLWTAIVFPLRNHAQAVSLVTRMVLFVQFLLVHEVLADRDRVDLLLWVIVLQLLVLPAQLLLHLYFNDEAEVTRHRLYARARRAKVDAAAAAAAAEAAAALAPGSGELGDATEEPAASGELGDEAEEPAASGELGGTATETGDEEAEAEAEEEEEEEEKKEEDEDDEEEEEKKEEEDAPATTDDVQVDEVVVTEGASSPE